MSRRRTIPLLALTLGALLVAVLGLRDWTIETGRAAGYAGRMLDGYGLSLAAQGPTALRLLPTPRLTLENVRLAASGAEAAVLADGGRLTLDLDVLGLLAGRATVSGGSLDGARLSRDGAAWAKPLARMLDRMRAGVSEHPRRLALRGGRLAGADADALGDIDLGLSWPLWSDSAELRGSVVWRGVPARIALTSLRPFDLADGRRTPFAMDLDWADGRLSLAGSAGLPGDGTALPAIAGRGRFETRSLPETLAWVGLDAPLAPLAGALTLEGSFESSGRSAFWPDLRVGLGSNTLEGAGALSLGAGDGSRLSVQATLAAEALNLAPLAGALVRLFESPSAPLALAPLVRADLDLRLSAASGRIGPLQLQDLAASVLVRDSSLEVAVNRARLQDGTLKGRLTLASAADPAETETRLQASFDRLDLGGVLGEFGTAPWLRGPMQGQVTLEGSARDSASLLARVGGRAALSVDGGVIAGLDLADVVHRNGTVAPGALARRNGRTSFERASATLRFSDGIGEITEAALRGPGIGASLRGQVSLPRRRIAAQVDVSVRHPAEPARTLAFEITGPWDDPDAQVLGRAEAGDPSGRAGEAMLPGPLDLPAALGLTGGARAYAP